jgi:hypothetical protein
MDNYRICAGVNTSPVTNSGDFSCMLAYTMPLGFYNLFSTLTGSTTPLTVAPQQVELQFPLSIYLPLIVK